MGDSAEKQAALELIAAPAIEKRILVVRERQVMLDEDLADLYGVETRVLVQQVRRNEKRFPADFMFQLSAQEFDDLKSQSVISSGGHGGRRKRPLVFTEQGVAMLSGVLRSERAIAANTTDRVQAPGERLRLTRADHAARESRPTPLGSNTVRLRRLIDRKFGLRACVTRLS
jgi:hypothetical protein